MSEAEPGADRQLWETEYEGLADELRTDPAEALPELRDLYQLLLVRPEAEAGADLRGVEDEGGG